MKKTLKILILTLLISFGFLTNLKADTEYKTKRIWSNSAYGSRG